MSGLFYALISEIKQLFQLYSKYIAHFKYQVKGDADVSQFDGADLSALYIRQSGRMRLSCFGLSPATADCIQFCKSQNYKKLIKNPACIRENIAENCAKRRNEQKSSFGVFYCFYADCII